MRWLKRVVVGFFALVGIMTVSLALLAVWLGASLIAPSSRAVPEATALELDLTKAPAETGAGGGIVELLSPKRMTLRQIEEALDRAGRDDRVKGLVVRLGESFSYATNEELRDAIAAFRKRGKFTIAFAESYGEAGSGSGGYPIAAACEEIWLQPSGELNLVGVIAETPFLRGTLDKLGIVPRVDKREEYKSAIDELTDTAYSPAFKESLQSILGSLYDQLAQAVADGRGLGADATKALIDRGPFLAEEAVAAKLVDRLGYHDEARDAARRRAGPGGKLVQLPDYFRAARDDSGEGPVIAMIAASGPIVSGSSGFDDAFGVSRIGADTLSDTIDEAVRSGDVAAILLRIDSPGGSYVASDTIWRAVNRAKAAGKPVIVSMGDVAASGGYFIAVPATKIVAEPGTLTGSIGVFGGKLVIKGLFEKLGISVDFGPVRHQCCAVELGPGLHARGLEPPRGLARCGVQGLHRQGGCGARPRCEPHSRDRQGTRLHRGTGVEARARRCARGLSPGARACPRGASRQARGARSIARVSAARARVPPAFAPARRRRGHSCSAAYEPARA